jgi:hypothetical protein
MPRQQRLTRPVVPLAAGVLLAWLTACGGSVPTVAPTTPGGAFPAGEPVDLVYISNSAGIGVAEKYGKLAAEALGREVRVHDHTGLGSLTHLLQLVRSSLADEVAGAEIIVVFGDVSDLADTLPRPNILTCVEAPGDPGSKWQPPVVPTVEDWRAYRDVWNQMYAEIWDLREGRPTILRAQDVWNPFLSQWIEAGIEPECTANWEIQTQVVKEAAEANNAVFVSVYDVFNGPNHDEDPVAKGWIGDDAIHPNDTGRAAIAEALAAVGFEASEPPR